MDEILPIHRAPGTGLPFWDAWGWPIQLVIVAAVAWFLFQWLRSRPAFQIKIRNGVPQVVWGKVRPTFLAELTEMLPSLAVTHGTIAGHRDKQRLVLKFSREFSAAAQQQVRNVWYAG